MLGENTCTIAENPQRDPADFETAISATKVGAYNLLLLLIIFPSGWANSWESTTMSYVFPAAQCDLDLNLEDKGLLNAITYLGMISSAVVWGFLFDTLGRRKLLMIGFFLDFICVLTNSFSQTKAMLIATKFFGGFIINGPYAALSTYISEFHNSKNRGRMQLFIAICFGIGGLLMPSLSIAILSQSVNFSLFNESLQFHSWNIFVFLTCLPALVAAIIFYFMPESPKFLMTIGENEKALNLFRKVYSVNTRQPPETFPITALVEEIKLKQSTPNRFGGHITARRSQTEALREGWQQIKPLFYPPLLWNIVLMCLIQTLFTMCVNTLRLWWPQIFQALNDYEYYFNASSVDLCRGLELIRPSNTSEGCVFNTENSPVYFNIMIVNCVVMLSEFLAACFINAIGKKKLLFILGLSGGLCSFIIYFSTNTAFAVTFSSLYTGTSAAAANVVVVITIDLFPTELRTISLSLTLMCGRIGSMLGNLAFPYLIRTGCAPPFFAMGALLIGSAFLSLLVPNTDLKPMV